MMGGVPCSAWPAVLLESDGSIMTGEPSRTSSPDIFQNIGLRMMGLDLHLYASQPSSPNLGTLGFPRCWPAPRYASIFVSDLSLRTKEGGNRGRCKEREERSDVNIHA